MPPSMASNYRAERDTMGPAEILCFHDYGQEFTFIIVKKPSPKVIHVKVKKYELNSQNNGWKIKISQEWQARFLDRLSITQIS